MKAWSGLTRTEHSELKFLKRQEAALVSKYDKRKQTIENRHLTDEAELDATVGKEIAEKRERIAALEAKVDKPEAV